MCTLYTCLLKKKNHGGRLHRTRTYMYMYNVHLIYILPHCRPQLNWTQSWVRALQPSQTRGLSLLMTWMMCWKVLQNSTWEALGEPEIKAHARGLVHCICVCTCTCTCIYMYLYMRFFGYIHVHVHVHAHVHRHLMCDCTCTCTVVRTCIWMWHAVHFPMCTLYFAVKLHLKPVVQSQWMCLPSSLPHHLIWLLNSHLSCSPCTVESSFLWAF